MNKRVISLFLVIAALVSMMIAPTAQAAGKEIQVTVNDNLVDFPDAKPYVDGNNRTLIPVRFVSEAMQADVSWDQGTQTASIEKDGTKVEITIGKKDIKVTKNGKTSTVTMDTMAVNDQSRTYVPIRYVAEALGAYVGFSDLYNSVEIVMPEEVTAEEIERLRSYDMIQWLDLKNFNETNAGWWLNRSEYKAFKDTPYWFSNSHYFLVTYDQQLGYTAKNEYTKTKAVETTNARDYAQFVVQYANDEFETKYYQMGSGEPLPGYWSNVALTCNFRTDDSLVYQMICQPQAMLSVRGIMEVTPVDAVSFNMAKDTFGIEDPEVGKTYVFDAEAIFAVDKYGYLNDIAVYTFNADGTTNKLK